MRRAGHVASMAERKGRYVTFWFRNLRETDHVGDLGVDRRIILKCTRRRGCGLVKFRCREEDCIKIHFKNIF
jgi:hypothetical protein